MSLWRWVCEWYGIFGAPIVPGDRSAPIHRPQHTKHIREQLVKHGRATARAATLRIKFVRSSREAPGLAFEMIK